MKKNHKYILQQYKNEWRKIKNSISNNTRTKWRKKRNKQLQNYIITTSKYDHHIHKITHTKLHLLNHLLHGHHHPGFWGLFWVFKMEMYVGISFPCQDVKKINENISKMDFTTISLQLTIDVDILFCPMSRCGAKAVVSAWAQALWCLPSDELSLEHLSF